MLVHIDIFFMMFYYEKRVNGIYIDSDKLSKNYYNEFYQWLFWSQPSAIQKNFLQNRDKITKDSKFSEIEENLLFEVAPADIHLKYLFLETDVSDVISCLISNVFDKNILDKKLTALMKNLKSDFG